MGVPAVQEGLVCHQAQTTNLSTGVGTMVCIALTGLAQDKVQQRVGCHNTARELSITASAAANKLAHQQVHCRVAKALMTRSFQPFQRQGTDTKYAVWAVQNTRLKICSASLLLRDPKLD